MLSRVFHYEKKKERLVPNMIVTVFIIIMSFQNVYATDSSYEEKIETSVNLEYITSYLISILYNMFNDDYEFAQVKLVQLPIEYDKVLEMIDSDECDGLDRALGMLQHISPESDTDGINEIFSYVFEKLNECKHSIVGKPLLKNLHYNISLIITLLEKSQEEYILSDSLYGKEKILKIQESLSITIRAHMLVTPYVFNDVTVIEKKFSKLFLAYNSDSTSEEIISLSNTIIDDLNYALVAEGLKGFAVVLNQKQELSEPEIFLKVTNYSNNHVLVELYGKNFDEDKNITIEYISPNSENLRKLVVRTNISGNFNIPLEFVKNSSEESYFFSIDTGQTRSYKLLEISDT